MRTIGRHRPRSSPTGDYVVLCDGCEAADYRSNLRRDRQGKFFHPGCEDRRDDVDLAEEQAAAASAPFVLPPKDGGRPDTDDGV